MTAELGQMCKKKSRLNTVYHFSETYLVVIATHYILDMLELISSKNTHAAHLCRKYPILCDFIVGFSKQHVY